jgi:hypothetical protein
LHFSQAQCRAPTHFATPAAIFHKQKSYTLSKECGFSLAVKFMPFNTDETQKKPRRGKAHIY